MKARNRIAVLAMFIIGWPASAALAQQKEEAISSLEDIEKFYGGKSIDKDLKKRWPAVANKADKGLEKDDEKIFDTAAKYYVFRVTWPEYVDDREKMAKAVEEFANLYKVSTNLYQNQYFHKQLAANLKQVFAREFLKNRLSSSNAGLMLLAPALHHGVSGPGKSKNPELSELLTDLVRDEKQHDALKVYAIKALGDYFPLQDLKKADPKQEPYEQKRVDALARYIDRAWPASVNQEAIFYLRREAIQSLARAQLPSVALAPDADKGQVAIALLKVLAKGKLSPPPASQPGDPLELMGLAEKCHAAFGLCDMKPYPKFQPHLCVYAVGHCLVDFLETYQRDQPNIIPPKDKKAIIDKSGERKVVLFRWKEIADRWLECLQNLDRYTATEYLDANNQAKEILNKTRVALSNVSKYGEIEPQRVTEFRDFMKAKEQKPARDRLFSDSAAPEIILGY